MLLKYRQQSKKLLELQREKEREYAKDENAQWREEDFPRHRNWKDHARASWQAPPS